MAEKGLTVERSTVPTSIQLSQDPEILHDTSGYTAKVSLWNSCMYWYRPSPTIY